MVSFSALALDDRTPIYLQLIGFIKRGIAAGTIVSGDEMPSRRMLSALLGVNPNTVQKSYALLEEEGLIRSRVGAKSEVAADGQTVQRLRQELLGNSIREMVGQWRQLGLSVEQVVEAIQREWTGE